MEKKRSFNPPLVFAIKKGLKLQDLPDISDLSLTDADELSAYACAAATLNASLCLQLECLAISTCSNQNSFSFAQVRRALHRFHHSDSLYLEVLFAPRSDEGHAGWCDFWGEFLEHGGPEHVALPVNGYWQWCSEWQSSIIEPAGCRLSPLPPPNCQVQWFRLRKRKAIVDVPFFAQAIQLICAAEDEFYDRDMIVNDSVINGFKEALSLLMNGIRTAEDAQVKAKAAAYLQLAMQRLDSLAPDRIASSFASNNNLLPLNSVANSTFEADASTVSLPTVTKTFPLQRLASKIFSRRKPKAKASDELRFCPVCSARLPGEEEAHVEHLNDCLSQSCASVRGDRYTVLMLGTPDPRECPICCEEFVGQGEKEQGGERIAVMNCLCRFHERCIERWFARSPTCPFHFD
jgi:hypothetical protein